MPEEWVNIDASNHTICNEDGIQFLKNKEGKVVDIQLGEIVTAFRKSIYPMLQYAPGHWVVEGLLSLAAAGLVPSLLSLVPDNLYKQHDKFTWGMYNFSFNLATAVAALSGAWIAHHISLNAAFSIMIGNASIAFILAIWLKTIINKHTHSNPPLH